MILESFLESCKSLEKIKCDGLQDQNGSPINYGMKSQKLANILSNLFTQNGQTLQVKLVKYSNYQFLYQKSGSSHQNFDRPRLTFCLITMYVY